MTRQVRQTAVFCVMTARPTILYLARVSTSQPRVLPTSRRARQLIRP